MKERILPRILLVGHPNCGKSTIFNLLTGGHAKTGNWHGVTVGASEKTARLGKLRASVIDLPGIYALGAPSMEERCTRDEVEGGRYALAAVVADALTLPRSAALLRHTAERAPRTVLIVTMCDLLARQGGFADERKLSKELGVPVLCISARRRAGAKRLKAFLADLLCGDDVNARSRPPRKASSAQGCKKADALACPIREGYFAGKRGESRAERLLFDPRIALPLFFLTIAAVFFFAFGDHMPGVFLKERIESAVSDGAGGRLAFLVRGAGGAEAAASFVEAFFGGLGMLLSFLPQIAILFFALFLMEESGYMSALAFMTDGLFRRVGLTGRAVFSLLMGFGCTAAALLTTRGLENERLQRRVAFILPYIPCSAKMPVFLTIAAAFFSRPFLAVVLIYAAGAALALTAALVLARVRPVGGEFVMEIARLRLPSLGEAVKSLLFYLKQFIMKIVTTVSAVLIVMWLLLSFDFSFRFVGEGGAGCMAEMLCRALKYLFYPMGITDWRIALSALSGLAAKESVAGMLSVFYGKALPQAMSTASAAAFTAFMLACPPCVSALAAAAREIGRRRALAAAALGTVTAFALAYAVYAVFTAGALLLPAAGGAGLAFFAFGIKKRGGKKVENISRTRARRAQRFHGQRISAGLLRLLPSFKGKGDTRQRKKDGAERSPLSGG